MPIDENSGFQQVVDNFVIKTKDQSGAKYLSYMEDGSEVGLFDKDDDSVHQTWRVTEHILAGDVTGKKVYLSCTADGSKVDLFLKDDNSGRQRWRVIWPKEKEYCYITVCGGVSSNKIYLSRTADGSEVGLFDKDDDSDCQRWVVEKVGRDGP